MGRMSDYEEKHLLIGTLFFLVGYLSQVDPKTEDERHLRSYLEDMKRRVLDFSETWEHRNDLYGPQ